MAGATLTDSDSVLQDAFGEGVSFLVNVRTQVMNRFSISPKKFDGRVLRENIGTGMPAGGGAYGPSLSAVPAADTSNNAETYIYHSYIYDTISVDWDVMEQSSGNHAYIDVLTQEMTRVAQFRTVDFERMMLGDGSGRLAWGKTVASIVGTPGTDPLVFTIADADAAVFFTKGLRLQFLRTSGGGSWYEWALTPTHPSAGYYTVSSVTRSKSANTTTVACVEINTGTAVAAGDAVIKYGSVTIDNGPSTSNTGNELIGLDGHISQSGTPLVVNTKAGFAALSTHQNIDPTTNGVWQSAASDGTGQWLNVDLVEEAADDISIHGGLSAEDVQFIVAHPYQVRKHLSSLYIQERYPNGGNAGKFTSGADTTFNEDMGPMIGTKPTVKSRFCSKAKAYLVGPGILHYDLKSWGFADKDGSIWEKDSNGRPAYVAKAYCYKAVGTTMRNCSGVISGLTETG